MVSTVRFLALLVGAVIALPPEWCRSLPGGPYLCCDACCEGDEEPGESEDEPRCQCGKLAMKRPDDAAEIIAPPPPAVVILPPSADWSFSIVADVDPLRAVNRQQLVCRWLN